MILQNKFGEVLKLAFTRVVELRVLVFLVLCLVLGGTSQDIGEPKLPIYIVSLIMIGWSLFRLNGNSRIWLAKPLIAFAFLFILLHLIYLIPLPPSIWENIAGREVVSNGFDLIGEGLPWLPLSLTPEKTLFTLFDLLPPLAMLLAMSVLVTKREVKIIVWGVLVFAILTVIMGLIQMTDAGEVIFLYKITNRKFPVGFFSNVNHQASFLLMAIPFAISLIAVSVRGYGLGVGVNQFITVFGVVACVVFLVGILLTRSVASYFLLIIVLIGPLFFCMPRASGKNKWYFLLLLVLIGVGIVCDYLFFGNHIGAISYEINNLDQTSRKTIYALTGEAAKDFFPFGTGPGSFNRVYLLYEEAGATTIPHAHNDYLEVLLEFGLIGVVFGIAFLTWLAKRVLEVLKSHRSHLVFAKCASFSVLSILLHSIADYPMRTIGLSTFFVFCLCLVVLPFRFQD